MAKPYVTPPPGDPNYPAMVWHPTNGTYYVAKSAADVPEGYLPCHPNDKARMKDATPAAAPPKAAVAAAPAKPNGLPMTRDKITIALLEGGIVFKRNMTDQQLYGTLMTALKRALTEKGVKFPANAEAPALLELLPLPE